MTLATLRRIPAPLKEPDAHVTREWILTNGLGGYASGTVSGIVTRRYHGLLVAAMPAPTGRMVMVSHVGALVRFSNGDTLPLDPQPLSVSEKDFMPARLLPLVEFRLESGLPVWRYETGGLVIEKRVLMPHRQNTSHLVFQLLQAPAPITLELRPFVHVRYYESSLRETLPHPYTVVATGEHFEILPGDDLPVLRMALVGHDSALTLAASQSPTGYHLEEARGYEHLSTLWSPGYFSAQLSVADASSDVALVLSTETWETIDALTPAAAMSAEVARRQAIFEQAPETMRTGLAAELLLAADQFLIAPAARPEDETRALAFGTEARTIIAGYHWFTDWGRDTMISLEGLTLSTGRAREARLILRTFATYVRDGLIPNMFPDSEREGLYHTADATLWFFHAIDRYVTATGDRETLKDLLPILDDIIDRHVRGTRFGIGVDPADGLLRQGADGYQLTWMDAKVNDWVVTPRRGKAVEINALFYNALRLLEGWLSDEIQTSRAAEVAQMAARLREAFNQRFWNSSSGHLFDVVDGEQGDDPSCRPNQLFAISLPHPVLAVDRWRPVLDAVHTRLVTRFGLRTLSRDHPQYQPKYDGDLRARDAAYHQGTVWPWLTGAYVDAWLRVHGHEGIPGVRTLIESFDQHLSEAGIGTISEIFDAEPPHRPRGCISQAWSVAELLRILRRLAEHELALPDPTAQAPQRV
jgi:predicted glycogen debranching enzyme